MDVLRLREERSLALNALVIEALERDERVIDRAVEQLARWRSAGVLHESRAARWQALFRGPRADLLRILRERSEDATTMRSCSPFAGVIDPRTRWRVWGEVRERLETTE